MKEEGPEQFIVCPSCYSRKITNTPKREAFGPFHEDVYTCECGKVFQARLPKIIKTNK